MSLKEKIHLDLVSAQKEARILEVSVLRMLQAALHNRLIEKRARLIKDKQLDPLKLSDEQLNQLSELEEREMQEVIRAETKKRKEAIELYQKGNRMELFKKESNELALLERYLPSPMNELEVEQVVVKVISELEVQNKKDFGKVMKEVVNRVQGRADGALISKIAQRLLS